MLTTLCRLSPLEEEAKIERERKDENKFEQYDEYRGIVNTIGSNP